MLLAREDENKKSCLKGSFYIFMLEILILFNSWFQELTPDQWHE